MTLTEQTTFLSKCPTVGMDTAQQILAYCGSLEQAAQHGRLDRGLVPGISKKRGSKIRAWINRELKK